MTRSIATTLYAAFLLIGGSVLAQPARPLLVALPSFDAHNISVPDAVLKAARQAGVPLGLDASDTKLWKREVSLKASNSTLGEVLRQILGAAPAYTVARDGGAVVIRPVVSQSDLLNTRILVFKTDEPSSADDLSFQLWMTLVQQLSPSRGGFLGGGLTDLNSSLEKPTLPPVDLSGKTVWEILDWIVGAHGSAAWVGLPFNGEISKSVGPGDLWRLERYVSSSANPHR
jgi:hypothetical protein